MEIKVSEMLLCSNTPELKAVATIVLEDSLEVHGIKVIQTGEQLRVVLPGRYGCGEDKNMPYAMKCERRRLMRDAVFANYEDQIAVEKQKTAKYEFRGVACNEGDKRIVYGGYYFDYKNDTEYIIGENRDIHKIFYASRGMKMRHKNCYFYHGDILSYKKGGMYFSLDENLNPMRSVIGPTTGIVSNYAGKAILNLPRPAYIYENEFIDSANTGLGIASREITTLNGELSVIGNALLSDEDELWFRPNEFKFEGCGNGDRHHGGYWFDRHNGVHYIVKHINDKFEFIAVGNAYMRLDTFNFCRESILDEDAFLDINGDKVRAGFNEGKTEITAKNCSPKGQLF